MENAGTLKYTRDHEWARVEKDETEIGITDFAQKQLGDIVSIELPSVGDMLIQGKTFAIVDSMKASSDVYAPVSGEVVAVNEELLSKPELVNSSPYEKGWFVKIRLENVSELDKLLTKEEYESFCKNEKK